MDAVGMLSGQRRIWGSWQRAAWVVWALICCAGIGRAALYNQPRHQGCYDTFHDAGGHWRAGQHLYNLDDLQRLDAFRYSPLFAAALAPVSTLAPPAGSAVIRFVNLAVFLLGLCWWGARAVRQSPGRDGLARLLLLTALAGGGAFFDIQFNLFTIGLMLIGMAAVEDGRWSLSALALALAVCCKAYPLALALVLILLYPRRFGPRFVIAVGLWLALPFALQSPAYVAEQYQDWLHAGLNSRYKYGLWFQDAMYLWQRWIGPIERSAFLLASAGVGALIAAVVFLRRYQPRADLHTGAFGLCAAWMMAFGPATEATTYVMLAPLASLAMLRAWDGDLPLWQRGKAATAYGLMTLSVLQLIFPLDKPLHHLGAQPLAALLLMPVFALWRQPSVGGLVSSARSTLRRAAA